MPKTIRIVDLDNPIIESPSAVACCRTVEKLSPPRWEFPDKHRTNGLVDDHIKRMFSSCILGDSPWPLLLSGETGSGKTCAALCVCDWAGDAIYTTINELCSRIIAAQHENIVQTEKDIWKDWYECNIAVLDEIGIRRQITDHHYETLAKALDKRIDRSGGYCAPLVLISNLAPEKIEEMYDARIASRMASGTIVETRGDRRLSQ